MPIAKGVGLGLKLGRAKGTLCGDGNGQCPDCGSGHKGISICQNRWNAFIICKLQLKNDFKRHNYKPLNGKPQNRKNSSQHVYLTKDLNSEYTKNSFINNKKKPTFKMGKWLPEIFHGRYTNSAKAYEEAFNIIYHEEIQIIITIRYPISLEWLK